MKMTIYHNPRCSKSRKTLEIIESHGITPNIVEYLATPLDAASLKQVAKLVGVPLSDLLRRGEEEFRDAAKKLAVDDEDALAKWLENHPKVLERPIVVAHDKNTAVVGRPPENVLTLIGE